MGAYITLFVAISLEIFGTMLLPLTKNFTILIPTSLALISYSSSLFLLGIVTQKSPLSLIYSTWTNLGVFFATILSYLLYQLSFWPTDLHLIGYH